MAALSHLVAWEGHRVLGKKPYKQKYLWIGEGGRKRISIRSFPLARQSDSSGKPEISTHIASFWSITHQQKHTNITSFSAITHQENHAATEQLPRGAIARMMTPMTKNTHSSKDSPMAETTMQTSTKTGNGHGMVPTPISIVLPSLLRGSSYV